MKTIRLWKNETNINHQRQGSEIKYGFKKTMGYQLSDPNLLHKEKKNQIKNVINNMQVILPNQYCINQNINYKAKVFGGKLPQIKKMHIIVLKKR